MYMHPHQGIVHTKKWSDGLYTILDEPNTLTCQSAATNDTPRDPLYGSVTNHITAFINT